MGAVFKIDDDNFLAESFENLIVTEGMFERKRLIIAKDVLFNKKTGKSAVDILLRRRDVSGSTVIFQERDLSAKDLKSLGKLDIKINRYDLKKNLRPAEVFNAFALTDAVGARDRRLSFFLFHKALYSGIADEEIFWKIYRQYKNLITISGLKDGSKISERTGLHPYVVKKCSSFLKNYSDKELKNAFEKLMSLWVDSRLKNVELSGGLELFLLSL